MKFNDWLDAETGRASRVAEHFERSLSAISQWRVNGVPKGLMKQVRDFTGGAVSLEEMLPGSPEPTVTAAGQGA